MTLKLLIADDEPRSRERLKRLLLELPGVTVIAEADSGDRAVLLASSADACFLDVEMPGSGGLEVASRIGKPMVFVTAHAKYAVAAFDVAAVDFLVKPVSAERLKVTVERLRHATPPAEAELVVVSRREVMRVDARAVTRFVAKDKYVAFLDANGDEHLLRESLEALHTRLGDDFVRVHKAELVRRASIVRLSGNEVELSDGQRAQVSRRTLPELKRLLLAR